MAIFKLITYQAKQLFNNTTYLVTGSVMMPCRDTNFVLFRLIDEMLLDTEPQFMPQMYQNGPGFTVQRHNARPHRVLIFCKHFLSFNRYTRFILHRCSLQLHYTKIFFGRKIKPPRYNRNIVESGIECHNL